MQSHSQEDHDKTPFPGIVELASQLSSILSRYNGTETSTPRCYYTCLIGNYPLYSFSTALLDAVIQHDTPINNTDVSMLLSIIGTHRDKITRALQSISLKCVAYLLLCSSANAGMQSALDLLLHEPEYFINSEPTQYLSVLPEFERQSQVIEQKLSQKLYWIFVNEELDIPFRRIAGKLLMETIFDSEQHCRQLSEVSGPYLSRIPLILLNNPDVVLKVFSSVILSALNNLQLDKELLWEPDGSRLRDIFFQNFQFAQEDVIRNFYKYSKQVKRHSQSHDMVECAEPAYCLLILEDTDTKSPMKGPVIWTYTLNSMNLITCYKYMSRWHFDNIEVPSEYFPHARCVFFTGTDDTNSSWIFHIHTKEPIQINGQKRGPNSLDLIVNSEHDLVEIQRGLDQIGIHYQRENCGSRLITRRSSSLMIVLDVEDDVANKPNRLGGCEMKAVSFKNCANALKGKLFEVAEKPQNYESDKNQGSIWTTCRNTSFVPQDSSMSTLTDLPTETPSGDSNSQKSLFEKSALFQNPGTKSFETGGWFAKSTPPSTEKTKPRKRAVERNKSTSMKWRPVLPNTQESLLFPRRRTRGKQYASKSTFDWEEDFRVSDTADGKVSPKIDELTSISSPAPGDPGCSLVKTKNNITGEEDDTGKKLAKNVRHRPKRKMEKKKGHGKMIVKLSVNPESLKAFQKMKPRAAPATANGQGDQTSAYGPSLGQGDTPTPPKKGNDASRAISKSVSSYKGCSNAANRSCPTEIVRRSNRIPNAPKDNEELRQSNQGRGQTMGEKLNAAFSQCAITYQKDERCDSCESDNASCAYQGAQGPRLAIRLSESSEALAGGHSADNGLYDDRNVDNLEKSSGTCANHLGDSLTKLPHILCHHNGYNTCSSEKSQIPMLGSACKKRFAASSQNEQRPQKRPKKGSTLVENPSIDQSYGSITPQLCGNLEVQYLADSPGILKVQFPHAPLSIKLSAASIDENSATDKNQCGHSRPKPFPGDRDHKYLENIEIFRYSVPRTIVDENGSPRILNKGAISHKESSPDEDSDSNTDMGEKELHEASRSGSMPRLSVFRTLFPKTKMSTTLSTLQSDNTGHSLKPLGPPLPSSPAGRPGLNPIKKESKYAVSHDQKTNASSLEGKPSSSPSDLNFSAVKISKGVVKRADGEILLEDLQKGTQNILHDYSQRLSRQIESERNTISNVLEKYREQCDSILDELFKVQEERIRVCKQQMKSIKKQHADVCRELINRLEENERCIQRRLSSGSNDEKELTL